MIVRHDDAPALLPGGSPSAAPKAAAIGDRKTDFAPREMLGTAQFYLLWFMYACGAGAGLMVIGKLAIIAKVQAGIDLILLRPG